ncbi:MAG: hypothetical protein ACLR56_02450 [Oscillospiraceae bacterium]
MKLNQGIFYAFGGSGFAVSICGCKKGCQSSSAAPAPTVSAYRRR